MPGSAGSRGSGSVTRSSRVRPARVSMSAASRLRSRSRRSGPSPGRLVASCPVVVRPSGGRGDGRRPRASTRAAAAAHWNRIGSSAAGRPIERDAQVVGRERGEHVGDVDGHDVVAGRDAGGGRAPACRSASTAAAERGDGDGHPAAGADGQGGHGVVRDAADGDRVRRPPTRAGTTIGTPPSPAVVSRTLPTSMPVKPSAVPVPTMPGPIADDGDVGRGRRAGRSSAPRARSRLRGHRRTRGHR